VIVAAEDGAKLAGLKPVIRDLMAGMERDLGTKLDWVAVDHLTPATRTLTSSFVAEPIGARIW